MPAWLGNHLWASAGPALSSTTTWWCSASSGRSWVTCCRGLGCLWITSSLSSPTATCSGPMAGCQSRCSASCPSNRSRNCLISTAGTLLLSLSPAAFCQTSTAPQRPGSNIPAGGNGLEGFNPNGSALWYRLGHRKTFSPELHAAHLSMSPLQKAQQRAEMDHCRGQGIKAVHAAELCLNVAIAGTREIHGTGIWKSAWIELWWGRTTPSKPSSVGWGEVDLLQITAPSTCALPALPCRVLGSLSGQEVWRWLPWDKSPHADTGSTPKGAHHIESVYSTQVGEIWHSVAYSPEEPLVMFPPLPCSGKDSPSLSLGFIRAVWTVPRLWP